MSLRRQSAHVDHLMYAGLRTAQMLNLHLLGPEPESPPPGVIQREVGRRLWLLLQRFEMYVFAFSGTSSLSADKREWQPHDGFEGFATLAPASYHLLAGECE